jgi:ubiquinone/menaquinone biosynthesis C-methylase UbiE
MKMTALEKLFVNKPSHARNVAERAVQLLGLIKPSPGWHYLDVGCGVGAAASEIAKGSDLNVTGIDVDPKQIAEAQHRAPAKNVQFRLMDATGMDFRDGHFDIVATNMVTHHIPNWEKAFSEMVRVLRAGGYLIYSDHVFPSWLARAGRRFLRFMGLPSANAIESLAQRAGLTKVYEAKQPRVVTAIWIKNA